MQVMAFVYPFLFRVPTLQPRTRGGDGKEDEVAWHKKCACVAEIRHTGVCSKERNGKLIGIARFLHWPFLPSPLSSKLGTLTARGLQMKITMTLLLWAVCPSFLANYRAQREGVGGLWLRHREWAGQGWPVY